LTIKSLYPFRTRLLIFFTGWVLWFSIQTLMLHRLGMSWDVSVIDASVTTFMLMLASSVTLGIFTYYHPTRSNSVFIFAYVVLVSLISCITVRWFFVNTFTDLAGLHSYLESTMPVRFVITLLILSFITITKWLMNTISEQKEKEKQQNEIENMMKEAELAKLRMQLQPHFLFNSLNSINALVVSKPELARKMVQQLSDFLRGTLKKDDQQSVKLKSELEHLQLYLDIEKVRFGHRLNIEIDNSESSQDCELPHLILQPIVENAIKFGLYDITGDVTISISSKKENSDLIVEVKNPFDPGHQRQGTGFGLSSIQRRLYLLFTRNDLLKTEQTKNTFITTLKIPQKK
jgi:two-component system, LytTR family, sensor kinase